MRAGLEVDSTGSAENAEVMLTTEQLDWAELIMVMEASHRGVCSLVAATSSRVSG